MAEDGTAGVQDGFERYFAEKLWEMIPAVYRHEDSLGRNQGTLRALVAILAKQAAVLRRSHDRLWEDQFIELCDDWAVPYLGDLVGTRMVSALLPRAQRVDVAKTLYYRRRAGTPAVLEELISDITRWEGTVVEGFRRLGRCRHRLDPEPGPLAGRYTGTPPGGWADLRRPWAAQLAGTAFDEFHHTPDLRRPRGSDGRYGIHRLVFHLYRLPVFSITGVTPCLVEGSRGFTFDPSGRDIPLFLPRNRPQDPPPGDNGQPNWARWRPAQEWELPGPLRCGVLGMLLTGDEAVLQDKVLAIHEASQEAIATKQITAGRLDGGYDLRLMSVNTPDELVDEGHSLVIVGLVGTDLHIRIFDRNGEKVVDKAENDLVSGEALTALKERLDPFPADSDLSQGDKQEIIKNAISSSGQTLDGWAAQPHGKRLVIDPERGRFLFLGDPPGKKISVTYHYGFSANIGAGTYDRSLGKQDERVPKVPRSGKIQAKAIPEEGVIQLNDSATYLPVGNTITVRDVVLRAANKQRPYVRLRGDWTLNADNESAKLVLEGLWIGGSKNMKLKNLKLVLKGDYESVVLRNMTLDPGGQRSDDRDAESLPPVSLFIEGRIKRLSIESSITGAIQTRKTGSVEELLVSDSIIQGEPGLQVSGNDVHLKRVTLLGRVQVHRLQATEVLVTGHANVTDTQTGCFRFGAAPSGNRLPRPYQSHWISDSQALFVSTQFGHPDYARLSEAAPSILKCGAENGSEIGAFNRLLTPIKFDSLRAKVEEFMPFGLLPIFIHET